MNEFQPATPTAQLQNGVFLSDLHLFSPRSTADSSIVGQLNQVRRPDQAIVLGGDIFDFRWSDLGGLQASLREAKRWLQELLELSGDSQVVFLLGNHDCHPDFQTVLNELAEENSRFSWQEHVFRIADCLFLHGDILDAGRSLKELDSYRQKFHHSGSQPKSAQRAYDVAVAMRVHKIVPKLRHRPQATCEKLSEIVNQFDRQSVEGVQRIFFGHTHVPIQGLKQKQFRFFNPGAALKHMQYQMHYFTIAQHV